MAKLTDEKIICNNWRTPFELSHGNETTTHHECIEFHARLASNFPQILSFQEIGNTDSGMPIHLGIVSADGEFDFERIKVSGRPILFNNNGIHPGEPEGVDVCMALVRDFCLDPESLRHLADVVFVYIPLYNVDGALNRQNTSRVNQVGPESFGFRGSARNLDLNRDFIKALSSNSRVFNRVFTQWDPDILVDTHTSNGADYSYVVTLIATQPDKLGGRLGPYLRESMLPDLFRQMEGRGYAMCPYVNPVREIPDDGIVGFLDTPRFSTGYAALHHCIGFMPETHMLKTFRERYLGTKAFMDSLIEFSVINGRKIRALRAQDRAEVVTAREWTLIWELDTKQHSSLMFRGYQAIYEPSRLGQYMRLRYDRNKPFEKEIPFYDRYIPATNISPPFAYIVPHAWTEVIERLKLNGVDLRPVGRECKVEVESYRIIDFKKEETPFEGLHLHNKVQVVRENALISLCRNDWVVPLGQARDRYILETLEPEAADSFFRWAFFDPVLNRKETFSGYVFEDEAERLLQVEPGLREEFEAWKLANSNLVNNEHAVLHYIFTHRERYAEPEWCRYPIYRIVASHALQSL